MRASKNTPRPKKGLVLSYLERISSKVFSDFPDQLTALARNRHGVYALYKGNRLYYVGLATDLRGRIKGHLKDKHAGRWDRFSLYLVAKVHHVRELESLVLRISDPKGNLAKGRLSGATNLRRLLRSSMRAAQSKQIQRLFEGKSKLKKAKPQEQSGTPILAKYVKRRFVVKGFHGEKSYIARVRKNGIIYYKGNLYNSPSLAAKKALGYNKNGWSFWHFKNRKGEWVRLRELKKGVKPRA